MTNANHTAPPAVIPEPRCCVCGSLLTRGTDALIGFYWCRSCASPDLRARLLRTTPDAAVSRSQRSVE
jgi:hypothetical protein